jgi:hypothetical protein
VPFDNTVEFKLYDLDDTGYIERTEVKANFLLEGYFHKIAIIECVPFGVLCLLGEANVGSTPK